ncbi:hypothetical protein [Novosphingobium aerophilum]|uniref:Uncharacterized protein n=1 Tax=Novosphingobium aerophilum TaxID=2839843 RepID=A0A7X1FA95_9SPHN|nr:hypothetical protein [Novosphingobium aerophilum]MBC2653282.1 hypothetical protein [Novosphingobium aerophilum]
MYLASSEIRNSSTFSLAEMDEIAFNLLRWRRKQAAALSQNPLAYLGCLLGQLSEGPDASTAHLADRLATIVPGLEPDDYVALVSVDQTPAYQH